MDEGKRGVGPSRNNIFFCKSTRFLPRLSTTAPTHTAIFVWLVCFLSVLPICLTVAFVGPFVLFSVVLRSSSFKPGHQNLATKTQSCETPPARDRILELYVRRQCAWGSQHDARGRSVVHTDQKVGPAHFLMYDASVLCVRCSVAISIDSAEI